MIFIGISKKLIIMIDQIDFSVYKMKLFIFELLIKIKYRSTENNIYTFEMKLYLCMKYVWNENIFADI